MLFDPAAIAARFGSGAQAFETSVYGDLPPLMAAGEAVAFGTRAGSTFALRIVRGPVEGEVIDAGPVYTSGQLRLAGWHTFTYGCTHGSGVFAEECPTVSLPAGWYRVSVARVLEDPADPDLFSSIAIGLDPIADPGVRPLPTVIPGSDGFF